MRIKLLPICFLLLLLTSKCFSQENLSVYELPVPANWHKEKFALPPSFAVTLPFSGTEDIRFSPEWSKKHTDGYWTYCFLWTIKRAVSFTKTNLELYLHDYYTGLVKVNLAQAKIDTALAIPVKVKLNSSRKGKTDIQTFEGQVEMLDYMTQDPIKLNLRIHIKKLKSGSDTGAVYLEASPQPYDHKVWIELDALDKGIK
ncbi:MAG: hypothetical protein JWR38_5 [Mucilaginibacter sp.]|nr:hypothetical protein [Mucilaginibacter sp.]